jgi:hypothetical protein
VAPATGFYTGGLGFGLFKLVDLPPRPSPFFKIEVPVAARETSILSIGFTSDTVAVYFCMISFGKSPKAEC